MKIIYINGIKRSIFIGLIVFFIATGTLSALMLNNIYLRSFEDLEEVDIERKVDIVNKEIQSNLEEIATLGIDWGKWDDTYLFAQGLDETYLETNLVDNNFEIYNVEMIMLNDDSGKLLYGKKQDARTGKIVEIDQSVCDSLFNTSILGAKDPKVKFNDVVVFEGTPMLVASHPIIKTDGSGDVKGNVIFARTMDADMMNRISEKLHLGVSLELVSKMDFDKLNLGDEQEIGVKLKNKDSVIGSYYLPEFFEKYYTKINVEIPRDVIKVGYNSIKILKLIVPLIFTLMVVFLWIILNKLILSRIVTLNNQVIMIKEGKSSLARIDVDNKEDEISELSQSINSMLDALESLQDEIFKANHLLEAKVSERTKELELEIIKRQKIQDEVTFLAHHDALTGLPNRLLLKILLTNGILNANSQGTLLGVMFMDLDGFKMINDTFGHDQGDELLKQVATRLSNIVSENDTVCRLGGDEFVLYINGYENEESLDLIASRVMDDFKNPFKLNCQDCFITGSIGVSRYPIDGYDVETLLKNADTAMYAAKTLGKNQYQKYSHDLE